VRFSANLHLFAEVETNWSCTSVSVCLHGVDRKKELLHYSCRYSKQIEEDDIGLIRMKHGGGKTLHERTRPRYYYYYYYYY
jgi:hypothetical protein